MKVKHIASSADGKTTYVTDIDDNLYYLVGSTALPIDIAITVDKKVELTDNKGK